MGKGVPKSRSVKDEYQWTFMLYLSGDNNLSAEMVRALNEIARESIPAECAFTIQYDPRSPCCNTYRYAITPEGPGQAKRPRSAAPGPLPIPQYLVDRLENENSASPQVLGDFIAWTVRSYPSANRMLILSGHGGGAVGEFLYDEDALRGQPGSLTIPELSHAFCWARKRLPNALSDGRRLLDVLGLDSCLMSTAEVGYELRDHVEYLVGSEGYVTDAGWPYGHLLAQLKKRIESAAKTPHDDRKKLTPENIARWTVEDCVEHYDDFIPAGVSIDVAACKLDSTGDLAIRLKKLADHLNDQVRDLSGDQGDEKGEGIRDDILDMIIVSHWRAQSYHFEQYVDLWDFCDQLRGAAGRHGRGPSRSIEAACQEVMGTIEEAVIGSDQSGVEFQHSHGLSVYFPWAVSPLDGDASLETYGDLAFADRSGWHEFLVGYLEATRRKPRPRGLGAILIDRAGQDSPGQLKAAPGVNKAAPGVNKAAPGVNKAAPGVNKAAPGVNKAAERLLRFAEVLMRLYGSSDMRLPWSMKNPPRQVEWKRRSKAPGAA